MWITWLLALPFFFICVCAWALIAPEDAKRALGNTSRKYRTWVWNSANHRFIRRHKNEYTSDEALQKDAEEYANHFTHRSLGEPNTAERDWW